MQTIQYMYSYTKEKKFGLMFEKINTHTKSME